MIKRRGKQREREVSQPVFSVSFLFSTAIFFHNVINSSPLAERKYWLWKIQQERGKYGLAILGSLVPWVFLLSGAYYFSFYSRRLYFQRQRKTRAIIRKEKLAPEKPSKIVEKMGNKKEDPRIKEPRRYNSRHSFTFYFLFLGR